VKFQEHELFVPPDDPDATIWRYIDFTRLVSLLERRSLFFARSDTLGDDFEGSYSRANLAARPTMYPDVPQRALAQFVEIARQMVRFTFISCWNLSAVESAALWGLYVPPEGGVAIRSSYRNLIESFGAGPAETGAMGDVVHVGRVRYVDYEKDVMPEGNSMWPFLHKRQSFAFEQELRAVVQELPTVEDQEAEGGRRIDVGLPSPAGLSVEVDLGVLIERVHVSPAAPEWFADLVRAVCARYGLEKEVAQSSLAGSPVY
jgi:hypothetical protein